MSLIPLFIRIYRKAIRPFIYLEKIGYSVGILKSTRLTLPDFLCIGVEKAGTTWLYENLKLHPEIFMSAKKEINYFRRKYWFYSFPLSFYAGFFSDAPAHSLKGEATPYCTMPLSKIRFVRAIMPNVKLILILRNPVDRLWSHGLMHLIRSQKRKFEDISPAEFMNLLNQRDILEFGFYPSILEKWRSVFPEKQIKVMFYDDLVSNSKHFLEDCFAFLEVGKIASYEEFYLDKYIFKGPGYPMPEKLREHFLDVYRPSILELSGEFGERVKSWLA
jgi:hypothetical protein